MRDYCADDLCDGARLELLDAAGHVVYVLGAGRPPSAQVTEDELARTGPGWRLRLLDADGEVLAELPWPTRH